MVFEKPAQEKSVTGELVKRVNEDTRRIRLVEQRIDRLEENIRMVENIISEQTNNLKLNLNEISQKITGLSGRLDSIEKEIGKLNKVLEKTVTKIDVKKLETFIDLVNPMTSKFVTKDEMKNALEEAHRS